MLGPSKASPEKPKYSMMDIIEEGRKIEAESNLVKNTCLREDLRKVMGFSRVDSVMKILKNHGLISGD